MRLPLTRRDALKLTGASLAVTAFQPQTFAAAARRSKKIVVAGGGIAGLCCAWELMRRGHDVTALEAASRAGGHVLTSAPGEFPDGLYADLGAERCTKPGYELYRGYVEQLGLKLLPYRRRDHVLFYLNGQPTTEAMLADRTVLAGLGLNQREIDFVGRTEWRDLKLLYFGPYLDKFPDEYQPFGVGLDELDHLSVPDFLQREGASPAAIRFIGRNFVSALHEVGMLAGLKHRGRSIYPRDLYRIAGGKQKLTDAFAAQRGPRVRLRCPITRIIDEA